MLSSTTACKPLTPSNNVQRDGKLLSGWSFEKEPCNDDTSGNHPTETGEEEVEESNTESTTHSRNFRTVDANDKDDGQKE